MMVDDARENSTQEGQEQTDLKARIVQTFV
jgi:hypothetical protein